MNFESYPQLDPWEEMGEPDLQHMSSNHIVWGGLKHIGGRVRSRDVSADHKPELMSHWNQVQQLAIAERETSGSGIVPDDICLRGDRDADHPLAWLNPTPPLTPRSDEVPAQPANLPISFAHALTQPYSLSQNFSIARCLEETKFASASTTTSSAAGGLGGSHTPKRGLLSWSSRKSSVMDEIMALESLRHQYEVEDGIRKENLGTLRGPSDFGTAPPTLAQLSVMPPAMSNNQVMSARVEGGVSDLARHASLAGMTRTTPHTGSSKLVNAAKAASCLAPSRSFMEEAVMKSERASLTALTEPFCDKESSSGTLQRFHMKAKEMGELSPDMRRFTKGAHFAGRLSTLTENIVHDCGKAHYAVVFESGELSNADGVGFTFGSKLPSTQNIQRMTSIFLSKAGHICLRANKQVMKLKSGVKQPEVGDRIEMTVDLEHGTAEFIVWPADGQHCSRSFVEFRTMFQRVSPESLEASKLDSGYLACVVKNAGVTVRFDS